ncbi:MAG: hypothetical protein QY305_08580 [Candidatus Brocadiaceae baterium WH-1]|nr:MAG: hypothetical protein QY305_08580 [Candidatus Jettenia sp. AMX2]
MTVHFILSEYINRAMSQVEYDKLEDGTFSGHIPSCKGVIAFGLTLHVPLIREKLLRAACRPGFWVWCRNGVNITKTSLTKIGI